MKRRADKKWFERIFWPVVLILVIAIWYVVTEVKMSANPVLVPSPLKVIDAFRQDWAWMLRGVWESSRRLAVSFLIAVPLSVYLAAWSARRTSLRTVLYPMARILSPIPPIVYSPFLIALMPSFRSASLTLMILTLFWPTYLGTIHQLDHIEEEIVVHAKMLELSDRTMVHSVLLPYALPGVITGLRTRLTSALMMLHFAEMMGADAGLGFYIRFFADYGNYSKVLAGIIVTSIVILILNKFLVWLDIHAIPWRRGRSGPSVTS